MLREEFQSPRVAIGKEEDHFEKALDFQQNEVAEIIVQEHFCSFFHFMSSKFLNRLCYWGMASYHWVKQLNNI